MEHCPDYLRPPSLTGHRAGTLTWDAAHDRFELRGEPMLLDFARRLFPGAAVRRDAIRFANHPREVGDLNWLLLRYAVDTSECADRLEAARTAAVTRWQRRAAGTDLQPTVPPTFRGQLYPYQQEAVTFLTVNRRCLLGDGMGLGKTWSALGACAAADRWPVLVVCQSHVLRQWQRVVGALSAQPTAGQQTLAAGLDGLQQRATCCVFVELDWAPAVHQQAECRVSRIGVSSAVTEVPSWYLVSRTGYDEVVLDVLGVKRQQAHGILGDEPEDKAEAEAAERRVAERLQALAAQLAAEGPGEECHG